jgi:hypothetical protein
LVQEAGVEFQREGGAGWRGVDGVDGSLRVVGAPSGQQAVGLVGGGGRGFSEDGGVAGMGAVGGLAEFGEARRFGEF